MNPHPAFGVPLPRWERVVSKWSTSAAVCSAVTEKRMRHSPAWTLSADGWREQRGLAVFRWAAHGERFLGRFLKAIRHDLAFGMKDVETGGAQAIPKP